MNGIIRWLIVGIVGLGLSQPASATFVDTIGDILPTYTGPRGADLDVSRADVSFGNGRFHFFGEMAGAIGTTPGAFYVWGLDRGAGTARFAGGTPSIGSDILFDSVVVIRPDGTGQVNDLIAGTSATLSPSTILIRGNTIDVDVSAALLPTLGRAAASYTWNLWPRVGAGSNAQISDFAPDNGNLLVSSVPEPSSVAMMAIGGIAVVGAAARRRHSTR